MNILFFLCFRRKINKEFPELMKNNLPKFKLLKGYYGYEVKMGTHSLSFHTEIGDKKPEDLAEFVQSQTNYLPTLKDVTINDCYGKMLGDYSTEHSRIEWWIKKGECMILFTFQGLGMPSSVIKEDVFDILNSLEYIEG